MTERSPHQGNTAPCGSDDSKHKECWNGPPAQQRSDGPLTVSASGSSTAIGTDTIARVDLLVRVIDRGSVTVAFGMATAESLAFSPTGGSTPFALAGTGVAVTGADFLVTETAIATGSGVASGQSWAAETSRTRFFALDVDGAWPACGPVVVETVGSEAIRRAPPRFDGNAATVTADARAIGENTITDVQVGVLALEDRLSTVDAFALAAAAGPASAEGDKFVVGRERSDRINLGAGDDWVFGRGGDDVILAGEGGNTAFGDAGDDQIRAGDGDDWLFGGSGRDVLHLGGGGNIGYGGAGDDKVFGGSGDDAISGGLGDDSVDAGGGNNSILLGSEGRRGDGDDRFAAGDGADWYFVRGDFDRDVARGFDVRQGDRLVAYGGDWDGDGGLRALNGEAVTLQRSASDSRDLVITFSVEGSRPVLILDDFFRLNEQYGAAPRRGVLSDEQALPLLRDLFVDGDTDPSAAARAERFLLGDHLGMFA